MSLFHGTALSLSDFDFSGFSFSKGWVGFFERKGAFSIDLVEEALHIMQSYFAEHRSDFFVITALCYNDVTTEKDKDIQKAYNGALHDMKQQGLLKPLNDSIADYFAGLAPLAYEHLQLNDHTCMDSLSRLLMAHAEVRGQICFFIDLKLNLAIYPHEDTGYGAMGLNGKTAEAIKFLEYARQFSDFRTTIKPQGFTNCVSASDKPEQL